MIHEPVMLNEVLEILKENLSNKEKIKILDGTLGAGGYSFAFLENFPNCHVKGIDRDETAIKISNENLKIFGSRFESYQKNFSELFTVFTEEHFDAMVFDLGVSNMQLTIPERGFSFQNDGPLDMRMNKNDSKTAADILNELDENELSKIFWNYGEERYAKLIASGIKNFEKNYKKIETTFELVNLIRKILPKPVQRKMGTHPARRIFQALRIFVNNETFELEKLLENIPNFSSIYNNTVIIIVSYHSIEDRIVKNKFRQWKNEGQGKILTRHPLKPTEKELERNYKSRSAKLRAFCLIHD